MWVVSQRMLGIDNESHLEDVGPAVRASAAVTRKAALAPPVRRARRATPIALAVSALALAGCAAGQQAQTAKVYSSIDGVNANLGPVGLRDAGISAPRTVSGYTAKGNAPLTMSITNDGDQADQLVAVSSPAATSVKITAPAAPGTAAPSTPSTATGQPAGIPVPPQGLVQVGPGQGNATITLAGLAAPLVSGQVVAVTFAFRTAGSKTVMVPIRLATNSTGGETVSVGPTGD